jgi:hypothetical protein
MTREDLVKQVMARVKVPVGFEDCAYAALDKWMVLYPASFKFGSAAVLAAERLLRRALNAAGRERSNGRVEEEARTKRVG